MLKYINIANIAVITQLRIDFGPGLNLITGETGAGKSIIIDALGLLLGHRGRADVVRTGEKTALIEGLFELTGKSGTRVREILEGAGVAPEEEGEWLLRREISASGGGGRSRMFINDRSVTAATVRALEPHLLEIHGQGMSQELLSTTRTHLDMLDSFADCGLLKEKVASGFTRWKEVMAALTQLERDLSERERVSDFLRFQIAEIERLAPKAGEESDLEAERTLLINIERALELSSGTYSDLYESDQSALQMLGTIRRRLQELASIDGRLAPLLAELDDARLALDDVAENLRAYRAGIDFSPDRLGTLEQRLAELERMKRKYGRDADGLAGLLEELGAQLRRLDHLAERERELREEAAAAAGEYAAAARRLSTCRREAAPRLEKRVMEELRHVALERAQFVVTVDSAPAEALADKLPGTNGDFMPPGEPSNFQARWTAHGIDRVEFLLSVNMGEEPRPLARVASGGELSRLMLTLRSVARSSRSGGGAASDGGAATLVFDEIDAGIGGRVAETVGRRLKLLARDRQIFCVTHQAQIARFADHHFSVLKQEADRRTVTSVRRLEGEERVTELARMIGAAEDVASARDTARWMLNQDGAGEMRAIRRGTPRSPRAAVKKK